VVQDAWARGQALTLHGWVYGLSDGLLQDLCMVISGDDVLEETHARSVANVAARRRG
jgi:carbonic anhydrase